MAHEIEIFSAGQHTTMGGESLAFSESELAQTVAAYDPSLHEAPIVVGHPQHDSPAYGWVRSLELKSARLAAAADQLDPAFLEGVRAGRWKKVSASFYRPSSPNNPKPGVWYLRHVGFLGAQPPAVKGLKQVEFAGGDEDAVTVEFGDWGDRLVVRLLRGVRDLLIEKFGKEEVEKAMPAWDIDSAHESAAQPDDDGPSYAEPKENPGAAAPSVETTKKEPPASPPATAPGAASLSPEQQARAEDLALREQQVAQREAELTKLETERRVAGYRDFCESLIKDGRPLPCDVDVMVAFCQLLAGDSPDAVSFGEGTEGSPVELFQQQVLARLPKQVSYGEFAAPEEAPVDLAEDATALAREIETYQREHKVDTVTAKEAVLARGAK